MNENLYIFSLLLEKIRRECYLTQYFTSNIRLIYLILNTSIQSIKLYSEQIFSPQKINKKLTHYLLHKYAINRRPLPIESIKITSLKLPQNNKHSLQKKKIKIKEQETLIRSTILNEKG